MKLKLRFFALSLVLAFSWLSVGLGADQPADAVATVKKATDELTAADKAVVAARNALQQAESRLDINLFSSAAYNVRITTQQLEAAKERHEKAEAKDKEDALEAYELAQELAEQRKTELQKAEELLPQRKAEAQAAEEKYNVALASAEKAAGDAKALVRQSEIAAAGKLKDSKVATEKASFSQAEADQKAAANALIQKAFADLAGADKALQAAAAALKKATDADRAKLQAEAEKAVKAYATQLSAVAQHIPAIKADAAKAVAVTLSEGVVQADLAAQQAAAALAETQKDVQNKVNDVKKAQDRIKAAQEGVEKRVAKTRAKRDLAREQEAAKRAEAAKVEAEKALPPKTAEDEKAKAVSAAALQAAVKGLIQSPDQEAALAAEKTAIAKAIADKEAEIKKENTSLTSAAAAAKVEADKAAKESAAADKLLTSHIATREALSRIVRQRFYRDAGTQQNEYRRLANAIGTANRNLQPKVAAFNKSTNDLKTAKDAAARAQTAATAQATALAAVTKEKQAAEKVVQDKTAAKATAQQLAKNAQDAATAAAAALTKESEAGQQAAEKLAKEKEATAKTAEQQVKKSQEALAAAEAALNGVVAKFKTAEKQSATAAQAVQEAEKKVAAAQSALDKATAEKTAAEAAVGQLEKEQGAASGKLAIAKAAAYGGLKPLDEGAWDLAKARHLMVRAGFGGTPDELAALHAMGLRKAVSHYVDFRNKPAPDIGLVVHPKEQPENYENGLSGEERRLLQQQRVAQDRQQIQNMRVWWLRRMIESPRPLEEKLTLFWHGQIPSQYSDVGDSYYMYLQNELFRAHAAGNFATLLHGIAHDAAMLKYLNNDVNVKGRANENLAREIMELFSMGRDQGYSEIDIRQGARALTGYTYDAQTGQFRFISDRHDTEPKTIFGKTGNFSGDDFAKLILETPAPSRFIARQMFSFFVHDDPSIDTVEALANVLRLNNYELTPMLENLFLSEEFYRAEAMSTQVKGPIQLVVGLHRDLGLKDADYAYLATATRDMGQELFEPPSVFGWQGGLTWVSTSRTFARYNVLAEIVSRRPRAGTTGVDFMGGVLAGKKFQNHGEVVDYLAKCAWNVPLSQNKRQALIEFLNTLPPPDQWAGKEAQVNARLTQLLVMLLCAPEYQLS